MNFLKQKVGLFLALLITIVLSWEPLDEFKDICGINSYENRFAKRIVGGVSSRRGEWPWLVSIYKNKIPSDWKLLLQKLKKLQKRSVDTAKLERYYKIQEKSSNEPSGIDQAIEEHICGGTLISDQWIVTARHCFEPKANIHLSKDPKDYMVVVGEHDIRSDEDGEFRHIEKIVTLSDANDLFADDIIMLKLKKPVQFNEYIRPACVATPSNDFGDDYLCQVAGWGHEKTKGKVQDTPRHITVPIISDYDKCVREFDIPYRVDQIRPHNSTFCAGEIGKDSCQYDSGGPLTCIDGNNRQTLKGIVAWGLDCGSEYPGIYTNVPLFTDEINRIMREE